MVKYTFKKKQRIVSNRRFKEVLDNRIRFGDGLLVMFAAPNDFAYPRLGVSVGKRFGNAVMRNRLKRRLKEAFRLLQHNMSPNYDYILMYNGKWSKKHISERKNISTNDVVGSLENLIKKAERKLQGQ